MSRALRVTARKKLRDFSVDVDLRIDSNITVMLGPSGHGKTTVLNMIAGMAQPDDGVISIGDIRLYDSRHGINVEMEKRGIGYVFQDYALFPHLSVFENVAYGLRARRLPDADIRMRVAQELERLAIANLKDELPARLSAGQRQRVALARALAIKPRVLLMDEPLSALDMQLRARVRSELKALLRQLAVPTIIVTHDALDAVGLGDVVMVMEHGRIVQRGTYETLLATPSSQFVAEFVESNAYRGRVKQVDPHGDASIVLSEGIEVHAVLEEVHAGSMLVVIHPWDVALLRTPEMGSIRNVLHGRVLSICPLRDRVRVMLDAGIQVAAEISRASLDVLELKEGEEIYAGFKTTAVRIFPLEHNHGKELQ
ncbi:MAG TPA: ABC transporter ATP-binding protein [Gallionella sp.]|nr:ABC transporter ATP-binding protein [Gallionella sp.]